MSWKNDFASILADCYDDEYDRMADRVEISNIDTINKQRGKIDVWFDFIDLSQKEGKLKKLTEEVQLDFGNLGVELQTYLTAARSEARSDASTRDEKRAKGKSLSQTNKVAIVVGIISLIGTLVTVFYSDIKGIIFPDPTPTESIVGEVNDQPEVIYEDDSQPSPEEDEPPPKITPIPAYTVAISEVMANPCGIYKDEDANWNEYIELYNYGEVDVDVGGWWISDGERAAGNPDQIVAWNERFPGGGSPGSGLLQTNTTIIPPKNYALVITPQYFLKQGEYALPYLFPENTILLTIADGDVLGSDDFGIEIYLILNPVTLYQGNQNQVIKVISTYGTPNLSGSPFDLKDDDQDNIPLELNDCYAAEKIMASGPDAEYNWRAVYNGTPGRGSE